MISACAYMISSCVELEMADVVIEHEVGDRFYIRLETGIIALVGRCPLVAAIYIHVATSTRTDARDVLATATPPRALSACVVKVHLFPTRQGKRLF